MSSLRADQLAARFDFRDLRVSQTLGHTAAARRGTDVAAPVTAILRFRSVGAMTTAACSQPIPTRRTSRSVGCI